MGRVEARALITLQAIWKNVVSTPGSAREARTQFELGHGDALVTYELEGLMMKQAGGKVEIVVPESTIFSEHPAVIIDSKVTPEERPVVTAFLQYLWSDEANKEFAQIKLPFYVADLGGWGKAYPDIIEKVFRDQVQKK